MNLTSLSQLCIEQLYPKSILKLDDEIEKVFCYLRGDIRLDQPSTDDAEINL